MKNQKRKFSIAAVNNGISVTIHGEIDCKAELTKDEADAITSSLASRIMSAMPANIYFSPQLSDLKVKK